MKVTYRPWPASTGHIWRGALFLNKDLGAPIGDRRQQTWNNEYPTLRSSYGFVLSAGYQNLDLDLKLYPKNLKIIRF